MSTDSVLLLFLIQLYIIPIIFEIVRVSFETLVNLVNNEDRNYIALKSTELAIVIPTNNSAEFIEETIRSLPRQYHIYCVANNCTDNTADVLRRLQRIYPNLHLIEINFEGKSKIKALVIGAAEVNRRGYSHFLLLDDDIIWPQHYTRFVRIFDLAAAITGLPVIPYQPANLMQAFQGVEYRLVALSKRAQRYLGRDIVMASGAAGIYRCDLFLEAMKQHTGVRMGDDFVVSYINHCMGYKIDFVTHPIIYTRCPATFEAWWKQRTRRWNLCFMGYCIGWVVRVVFSNPFKPGVGWWVRFLSAYRLIGIISVLSKPVNLPVLVLLRPDVFLGLMVIQYIVLALRYFTYPILLGRETFWRQPLSVLAFVLYPIYRFMVWASRIRSFPKALYHSIVGHPTLEGWVKEMIHHPPYTCENPIAALRERFMRYRAG